MKYNFFIITYDNDIYKYYYKDINNLDYAYFDYAYPRNKLLKIIRNIHISKKLNRIIHLPVKELWIKSQIRSLYKRKKKFGEVRNKDCFILFADCISMEELGLSKWIKHYFPNAKLVYYFQDIVSKDPLKQTLLKDKKKDYDLIVTYDQNDAAVYDLYHHHVPYSRLAEQASETTKIKYDICFIGLAKSRLQELKKTYEILSKNGFKCYFYIVSDKKEEWLNTKNGFIVTGEYISYDKYINIVQQSKGILEITQEGSIGNTTRVYESIEFDKFLLTNNVEITKNEFYNPNFMFVYDDISKIKLTQFDKTVSYLNKENLRPEKFLADIERELNKTYE